MINNPIGLGEKCKADKSSYFEEASVAQVTDKWWRFLYK